VKVHKTYSLNIKVVEAFEEELGESNKSNLLEALMIEYLIKYTRESSGFPSDVKDSNEPTKEIR